jgi:hypothetical protein
MTDLSPAAQAALNAFTGNDTIHGLHLMTPRLAAALRAVADQLVPEEMDLPPIAPDLGHFRQHERRLTRRQLLAIATELEQL